MKIKSFFSNLKSLSVCLVLFLENFRDAELKNKVNFLFRTQNSKKINLYTWNQTFSAGNPQKLNLALRGRRFYSTESPKSKGVKYDNADTDKLRIISENKGKSGIYMWINLKTGKRYIGSSVDLKRRFLEYYNVKRLFKGSIMLINRGLLKYGYAQFTL